MRFLDKLTELQSSNPVKVQANGTKLVGIPEQNPPLANHYIFAPMSSGLKQHLLASYKRTIPEQLLKIYDAANGCNLFWRCMEFGGSKFWIPMAQLSVYGVPAGPNRVDSIEPCNISAEDLDRPGDTPDNWLKFGCYRDFGQTPMEEYDLFADVDSGKVHSVLRKAEKCQAKQTWNTIDQCLCELFEWIQSRPASD